MRLDGGGNSSPSGVFFLAKHIVFPIKAMHFESWFEDVFDILIS